MKRGRHSTSSSFAFDQPSSSHLNDDDDDDDDDDGNNEGTSRASTLSPTHFVNSLTKEDPRVFENPPNVNHDMEPFYSRQTKIIIKFNCEMISILESPFINLIIYLFNPLILIKYPSSPFLLSFSSLSYLTSMASTQASSSNTSKKIKLTIIPPRQFFVNISSDEDATTTPYPVTKSSSLSLPNAPSKTSSTKNTSSSFGTISSSFESKPQSSPPSSNDTPSPQPSNPFINDIMDVPPRPSNPIPLQSYLSLDITLFLSLITPLDHTLDTPSPPSPPQPPLTGHPIYFNYHDYHGSTFFCYFHNRNLIFSLRDEINLIFAHIKYLITSAIASLYPPHPLKIGHVTS
nr:hypothetical protein [Tanacetum cinerariifolium]